MLQICFGFGFTRMYLVMLLAVRLKAQVSSYLPDPGGQRM